MNLLPNYMLTGNTAGVGKQWQAGGAALVEGKR